MSALGRLTRLSNFLLVSVRFFTGTSIFIEVPAGRPTGTSPFSQCSVTRPASIERNLKWHQAQQMHLVASQTVTICSRSPVLSMSNMLCYGMQIGQYRSSKINYRLLQLYEKNAIKLFRNLSVGHTERNRSISLGPFNEASKMPRLAWHNGHAVFLNF